MQPEDYLKDATAYFWEGSFAVIRGGGPYPDAFATIKDKNEVTVIIDQARLGDTVLAESEKGWKILTLDVVFPLDTVGILAKIASVLAEKGIGLLAVSAYSRDHFLVREKDMQKVNEAMKSIGITVLKK